ncbi:MAG: glycosyltransferase [Bdellovibrionota bacterium]
MSESNECARMKIAYISDQAFPVEKADAEQVMNNYNALVKAGLQIELIIPDGWNQRKSHGKKNQENYIKDFYKIAKDVSIVQLSHMPFTRWRLEKFTHPFFAMFYAWRKKFDVVYTRNLPMALIASFFNTQLLYETYKIENKNKLLRFILLRALKKNKLLGVITHSHLSKQSIVNLGIEEKKVLVAHNGFNPEVFRPHLSKHEAREKLNISPEIKIITYAGRIGYQKGLEQIFAIAEHLDHTFWMIGKVHPEYESWLKQQKEKYTLRNVIFIPYLTGDVYAQHLMASDILLIPPSDEALIAGFTVLPIKTFSYMACGRPILAPRQKDVCEVLSEKNAFLVDIGNQDSLVSCISKIINFPEEAEKVAKQALFDSDAFSWDARAKKITHFLREEQSDRS